MNLKKIFKPFCHQIPERCYYFSKDPLFICSRCLGIYLGFLISFFWFSFLYSGFSAGIRIFWVLLLFIPMALDGLTQFFNLRKSRNYLRFITGLLAGAGTAYLTYSAFSLILFSENILFKMPTLKSALILLLFIPVYFLIEKYKNKNKPEIENLLNYLSIFSLFILISAVIILYSKILADLFF
ncbi:MAG: DUF2085 domain-containing protein [Candidatus Undinarchaeales archaeon]